VRQFGDAWRQYAINFALVAMVVIHFGVFVVWKVNEPRQI
jgi:hypothetical protein